MPQMKPMLWLLMLLTTFIVLTTLSSIMYFSYSDKLPTMTHHYPFKRMKKTNDK